MSGKSVGSGAHVPLQRSQPNSFDHQLRQAIAERAVTLNWLYQSLAMRGTPVSMATLIGWRAGRLLPDNDQELAVVKVLESLLEMPSGSLLSSAEDPRPSTARRSGLVPEASAKGRQQMSGAARARAALGFEQGSGLLERHLELHLELDERGVERWVTQRTLWVAERDGVSAFPVVLLVPTPVITRSRVEALTGCRVGPEYTDLADGLFATTVLLDRPLRKGETAVSEHRTCLPADVTPEDYYMHRVLHEVDELEVSVHFHPDRVPRSVRALTKAEEAPEALRLVEPTDGTVHHEVRKFGPGAVGFRWTW